MDIALIPQAHGQFDIRILDGEPQTDIGLDTAVSLSLLCDRTAAADDRLPSGSDRRGWWADRFLPEPIGSRIWLTARDVRTEETLRLVEDYAAEALRWLTTSDIANTVTVRAEFHSTSDIRLLIEIRRPAGEAERFDLLWRAHESRRA